MSTTGIYGLSMLTKQNQYDKMYKEEVKNEWMKEAYSDLYSDLNTFNQTTLSTYKMSSTTSPMTATSTSEGVATATANADAASMAHTVNVTSLATNAYIQTNDSGIKRDSSATNQKSIYLKDLLSSGDSSYTADQKNNVALSFSVGDGTTTKEISFTYADLYESNQTLNDLATKIKNSGVNIQASYDSVNDSFSLYQKSGGKSNKIELTITNRADSSGDVTENGVTYDAKSDNRARTLLNHLNLAQVTSTTKDGVTTQSLTNLTQFNTSATADETVSVTGTDG